jgi:polyhydroxyalkanoate synthesis regulator phasin
MKEREMSKPDQDPVQQRITELQQRLADLHARLPAHSMSPAMAMEMETLEEAIETLQKELQHKALEN